MVTGGSLIVFVVVVLVDNPLCFFIFWAVADEEVFGFVEHCADVVGNAVVAQVSLVEVGVDGLDELENVGVIPHGFVESAGSAFGFRCSVSLVVEGFQFIRQFAVTVSTGEGASVKELGILDSNSHSRNVIVGKNAAAHIDLLSRSSPRGGGLFIFLFFLITANDRAQRTECKPTNCPPREQVF